MFTTKLILAAVLLVGASARYVPWDEVPYGYDEEYRYPEQVDQDFQYQHPGYLASARVRRQAHGKMLMTPNGATVVGGSVPLAVGEKNALSALGGVVLDPNKNIASKSFGLALDNINGHQLSVTKEMLPGGSKLTGAGTATLFHNDNHNLAANAFATRNIPDMGKSFNTYGGGVDYMFKDKIGGSLGMARTPMFGQNEYSAMGKFNAYRSPTSSFDLGAGFSRVDTPFGSTGFQPSFQGIWSTRF